MATTGETYWPPPVNPRWPLTLEGGDLLFELMEVVGGAEAGDVPGLFAEHLGEARFELVHAGGETGDTPVPSSWRATAEV